MRKNKHKSNKYFSLTEEVFEGKTFESKLDPYYVGKIDIKHQYDQYKIVLKDTSLLKNVFKVISASIYDNSEFLEDCDLACMKKDSSSPAMLSITFNNFELATKICEILSLYEKGVISFESLTPNPIFNNLLDFGTTYNIVENKYNNSSYDDVSYHIECSTKTIIKILNSVIATAGDKYTNYFHCTIKLSKFDIKKLVYSLDAYTTDNEVKTKIIEILEKTRDNE